MPERLMADDKPRTLYLVRRLQIATYLEMERVLRPFDITPTQYMVMSSLALRGRSSSAQLSRRFSVRPQSMIKLILGLEQLGHVQRVAREGDRRVLEISLSKSGKRSLGKCDQAVDALEGRMLAGLSEERHADLRETIRLILDQVGSVDPKLSGTGT